MECQKNDEKLLDNDESTLKSQNNNMSLYLDSEEETTCCFCFNYGPSFAGKLIKAFRRWVSKVYYI